MKPYELLKFNLDIIDAFVIHYSNPFVTQLWHSICEKGWFKNHSAFLTSLDSVETEMFQAYTLFIEQLPIQMKVEYIAFYENQAGRAWKQLYTHNKDVRHFDDGVVIHCGTKWWDNALSDFPDK